MTLLVATEADLDDLVRLRLDFIADVRGWEVSRLPSGYAEATEAFIADAMGAGALTSWLDRGDDGSIVGMVAMLRRVAPPRPEDLRRAEGFLLNLYVVPHERGRGRARALLDHVLAEAPALGVTAFSLHATDEARHLYETSGFAPDPTWMSRTAPD